MEQQSDPSEKLVEQPPEPSEKPCRHEYVRIYQRKIKGLERRLVATKAWLPVGFKQADFGHLSEGSYCFCTKCRARLYPKRTAAEKAAAREALAAAKAAALNAPAETEFEEASEDTAAAVNIHVEELEIESVELEDLEAGSVSMPEDEDACQLSDTE